MSRSPPPEVLQAALGGAVPAQPEGTTDCPYPYAALTAGGGGGGGERRGERAAKRQREEWVKDGRGWDRRAVSVLHHLSHISPYLPIRRSWIAAQCWSCRNLLGTF